MKIVSISWVRNECDILESFVRHHCALVDRMIIINHRSEDNSGDILKSLQDEDLSIDVREDRSLLHRQSEALTEILHELMTGENPPDWILPIDADECLVLEKGTDLHSVLQEYDRNVVHLLPWRTYVPLPEDDGSLPPYRRIRHRRRIEDPQWYKILIPSELATDQRCGIGFGNHGLLQRGTSESPIYPAQNLHLAHFPVRSAFQIMNKTIAGWLSYSADPTRVKGGCYQWKVMYDALKNHQELSVLDLKRMALEYATVSQWERLIDVERQGCTLEKFGVSGEMSRATDVDDVTIEDPVSDTMTLRLLPKPTDPWSLLLSVAEELAAAHAEQA